MNTDEKQLAYSFADELRELRDKEARSASESQHALIDRALASLAAELSAKAPPGIGDLAPDFELSSIDGRMTRLSSCLYEGPVVLTFYRGGWCEYCSLQLRYWKRRLPHLESLGGRLLAVSPQGREGVLATRRNHELPFSLLLDRDLAVTKLYRLDWHLSPEMQSLFKERGIDLEEANAEGRWILPAPATYVIGTNQRIELAFVPADYRDRLAPDEAIEALRQLTGGAKMG